MLFWVMWGSLSAAKDFTRDVPFEVDALVWAAFLGVCKFHRNIKLAEHAAKNLLRTETQVLQFMCNFQMFMQQLDCGMMLKREEIR